MSGQTQLRVLTEPAKACTSAVPLGCPLNSKDCVPSFDSRLPKCAGCLRERSSYGWSWTPMKKGRTPRGRQANEVTVVVPRAKRKGGRKVVQSKGAVCAIQSVASRSLQHGQEKMPRDGRTACSGSQRKSLMMSRWAASAQPDWWDVGRFPSPSQGHARQTIYDWTQGLGEL